MKPKKGKTRKKKKLASPMRSRNRWAVRGRNLAYFFTSFIGVILDFFVKIVTEDVVNTKAYLAKRKEAKKSNTGKALSQEGSAMFLPTKLSSGISLDQVIGLETAKKQIAQRMILPLAYAAKAKAFGIVGGGGLLLVGPPGNGKTTLAKAVAAEVKADFFHIKPSDIVRQGVGRSEQRIAELFRILRSCKRAVLFLDDAEGLIPSRAKNSSTIMKRVIAQILVEWDGLESSSDNTLLLMAASNEPWNIDLAFRRPGRFDVIAYVDLPNQGARAGLLQLALKNRPVADEVDVNSLAERTNGYSGADITELVNQASQNAFAKSIKSNDEEVGEICADDFNVALLDVKPSVVPDDLIRLIKFCDQYSIEGELSQ